MDISQLTNYRDALIDRFGEAAFKSWMSDIQLTRRGAEEVEVTTESKFRLDTLIQRFKPGMHDEWNRQFSPATKFSICLRRQQLTDSLAKASERAAPRRDFANAAFNGRGFGEKKAGASDFSRDAQRKPQISLTEIASPLDPRTTFDTFEVDDSNRIAYAAARQAFVDGAGNSLVYIYGPSGVGKTHLLHAVGHEWCAQHGGSAAYLTHSSLASGCVDAVLSNATLHLHKDLLSQRLLMIDDIHLLGGKNRTQQEVLSMVNAFAASGRQLIIAGEAPPRALAESGIHARLADRLAGGLAVPVEQGGALLRKQVLTSRTPGAHAKCRVEEEAIDFIADNFSKSMREAIGALNQLLLVYGEEERAIGRMEAEAVLRSRLSAGKTLGTLEDGVAAAADAFGLTVEDVKGRAQPQRIVKARHAFVYVAREVLKESFPRIAVALGRDHTTAMSSYRRAQALIERNKDFQSAVDQIRQAVGG